MYASGRRGKVDWGAHPHVHPHALQLQETVIPIIHAAAEKARDSDDAPAKLTAFLDECAITVPWRGGHLTQLQIYARERWTEYESSGAVAIRRARGRATEMKQALTAYLTDMPKQGKLRKQLQDAGVVFERD